MKAKILIRLFFLSLIPLLSLTAISAGVSAGIISSSLQARLGTAAPGDEIQVIVIFSDGIELKQFTGTSRSHRRSQILHALKKQADLQQNRMRGFLQTRGAPQAESLWLINGLAVTLSPEAIRDLALDPQVAEIRLDRSISLQTVPNSATRGHAFPDEWNINAVNARLLWSLGYRGQGVVLASMDTGVDIDHPDLKDRWRGGLNSWFDLFPSPGVDPAVPRDAIGHGTQTVGIMIGGDSSGTAIGVAPDAKWIAVKIFDDLGFTTFRGVHQGFAWLADPDGDPNTDDAPDIINNSWQLVAQENECLTEFSLDIEVLKALGIAVVFAAGNKEATTLGPSSLSPANDPLGFAVGAVGDPPFAIAPFSSRGPSACDGTIYPETVAPGINILTTDLSSGGTSLNPYITVSGTSFASAHVAGVMALLLSAFPNLPPVDPDPNDPVVVLNLEDTLKDPAATVDLGQVGPDNVFGNGLINAVGAFNLLDFYLEPCVIISADYVISPSIATLDTVVTFTSTVIGGTPPFAFDWDVNDDGLSDCNTADCTLRYKDFFSGLTQLTVKDAAGCTAFATRPISVGINVSGVVQDLNSAPISSVQLAAVEQTLVQTRSGSAGEFTLAGVQPDQRIQLLVQAPVLQAKHFIDTFSPFFIPPRRNINLNALIIRKLDIDTILQIFLDLIQSRGIIVGRVMDQNLKGLDQAGVGITDNFDNPIQASTRYLDTTGAWSLSRTETAQNGIFLIYNVPSAPRDIKITATKTDWTFEGVEARVHPFLPDSKKATAAPIVGQSIQAGGGCFISTLVF